MTLFDYFLTYMTELCEGKREAPDGIVLTTTTEADRAEELQSQIEPMGIAEFVRRCALQDGQEVPQTLYDAFSQGDVIAEPPQEKETSFDPDQGKHPFEIFLDCVAQDDGLVAYLADTLKSGDRTAFYKLSQITTHLDLDPGEFLFWLAHREDYSEKEQERVCAAVMDACLDRLMHEGQAETAAALLSGDQKTFEVFRCEAPELRQLPVATYAWFAENYLDRDYPIRFILKHHGVCFPQTLSEESHDHK